MSPVPFGYLFSVVDVDWDDCEPSCEEDSSYPIALYYPGHLDFDLVERLGRRYYVEYHALSTELADWMEFALIERPQHIWLRKIPQRGHWMMHQEQRRPGPGATPVTVFRWLSDWAQRPCAGGPRIKCSGSAVAGIPVSLVIDAPPDVEYVYLCRAHHVDFEERLREARYQAMAAAVKK